jgi:hypothetical protein
MTMTSSTLANETERAAGPAGGPTTDAAIRAVVTRLSRPRPSGGSVIERAAILAEGADADAIIRWILAQSGQPEAAPVPATAQGLHGPRRSGGAAERHPPRYVLPAGALTEQRRV